MLRLVSVRETWCMFILHSFRSENKIRQEQELRKRFLRKESVLNEVFLFDLYFAERVSTFHCQRYLLQFHFLAKIIGIFSVTG